MKKVPLTAVSLSVGIQILAVAVGGPDQNLQALDIPKHRLHNAMKSDRIYIHAVSRAYRGPGPKTLQKHSNIQR